MDRSNATTEFHGENHALQVGQNLGTINYEHGGRILSTTLPVARGAAFDSYEGEHEAHCLPDTRLDVLQQITDWVDDDEVSKPIFWLCGMAGTGKSTISRTVAETLSKRGILGASFSFSRDEYDRSRAGLFFTTIAAQLVVYEPKLAPHVAATINKDPSLPGKAMAQQYEHLIEKPFERVAPGSTIIIIDALDECEVNDVRVLVGLLSRLCKIPRLRVFVTSRPDTMVLLGFSSMTGDFQQIELHEILDTIVERDLNIFFEHRLAEARNTFNALADKDQQLEGWPDQSVIHRLSRIAAPLFICAATICRMIDDPPNDPETQLNLFLQYKWKTTEGQLYKMYDYILRRSCQSSNLEDFKYMIGSIVLFSEPLSKQSLADLLQIPRRTLSGRLASLNSVLRVSSGPVTVLHLSFRDFLLDSTTQSDFAIDEQSAHGVLFEKCLGELERHLRQNICSLQPSTLRSEIRADRVEGAISPATRYACLYWIEHFGRSHRTAVRIESAHQFLKTRFLHWLEALSLLEESTKSVPLIKQLASFVEDSKTHTLSDFLHDAWRFVLTHEYVFRLAPLQLYSSALVFTPKSSIVRTYFMRCMPEWLRSFAYVPSKWTSCLQTQDCGSRVRSFAFSPDGSKLAVHLENNTVQLWDPVIGIIIQVLDCGSSFVCGDSFSAEGRFIAIGTKKDGIPIWDPTTGILQSGPPVDDDWIQSCCSPKESLLIALTTTKIQAWDIDYSAWSYRLRFTRTIPDVYFLKVAFSSSGDCLNAFGYKPELSENSIYIFEVVEGNLIRRVPMVWVYDRSSTFKFSPNGKILAFSYGVRVETYEIETGEYGNFFSDGYNYGAAVSSLTISPDGKLIAAGYFGGVILVWSLATREIQQILRDSNCVPHRLSFSPDSNTMASGARDGAYRLWEIQASYHEQESYVTGLVTYPKIRKGLMSWYTRNGSRWRWNLEKAFRNPVSSGLSDRDLPEMSGAHIIPHLPLCSDQVHLGDLSMDCTKLVVATSEDSSTIESSVHIFGRGEKYDQLAYTGGYVAAFSFSPSDRLLAAVDIHGELFIWDADTLSCRYSIPCPRSGWNDCIVIAFSPTEESVAICFLGSKTISILDTKSGALVHTIIISEEPYNLAFDPQSDLLAVSNYEGGTSLYQFSSGVKKRDIPTHWTPSAMSISDGLLVTNQGAYSLEEESSNHSIPRQRVGLVVGYDWVTYNGEPILWIPTSFRNEHVAVQDNLVVLTTNASAPIFIWFQDLDKHFGFPRSLEVGSMPGHTG